MILLLILLTSGLLKLSQIKETANFLIQIMPVMFIPAGVGLIDSYSLLTPIILPFIIIVILSLLAVFLVTGRLSQLVIRKNREKIDE